MKIALDAREAFRPRKTGKGVWAEGLLRELLARGVPCVLVTDVPLPAWASTQHVEVLRIPGSGFLWHLRATRALAQRHDLDWFLAPTSFIIPFLLPRRIRSAVVIHDLIALFSEPHDRKARAIERLLLPRIVKKASLFLTVSESTKRDFLQRFPRLHPERVSVIFAGPLRRNATQNIPDGTTIICAATLCPRKNQERLIRAYAMLPATLRKNLALVLIGQRGWDDASIVRLARETGGVEWRNYVSEEEYERLLSTCAVFALPSLYEGFGMQILDALQRGIPTLTSNRGSLVEVVDGAALIVDPENVGAITGGLERLFTDHDLRKSLSERGPKQAEKFTWKRTVDLLLEALR